MDSIKPDYSKPATGNFTGSTLVVDPATGFLTSPDHQEIDRAINGQGRVGEGNGPLSVFIASKKIDFLSHLMELFPNYSECSKRCGITRATFKNHYDIDKKFKACVDEIANAFVDRVEHKRFELAIQDKGALDRMAVLNAYRREIYNPDIKVQVSHEMGADEAARRSQRLGNVVDAQIVEKVREQKKLRESNG